MTNNEKEKISILSGKGYSYSKIATVLDISENTIKAFCRRNKLGGIKGIQANENTEKNEKC